MRTAFIETLLELARQDPRIVLITGDLGFGVVTPFMAELPQQFVNAGVAEQNMTGLAAGMALSGKIVFAYSIANFPVIRPLEQIRNDVCYHNANVRIMAVGGGMAYGSLGLAHATEDIALMRALPNMMVVAPGDPVEARLAVRGLIAYQGPAYLRLGRADEPVVHQVTPQFELGKAITVRQGRDVTLIATGGMLYNAIGAARGPGRAGFRVSGIEHAYREASGCRSGAYCCPRYISHLYRRGTQHYRWSWRRGGRSSDGSRATPTLFSAHRVE